MDDRGLHSLTDIVWQGETGHRVGAVDFNKLTTGVFASFPQGRNGDEITVGTRVDRALQQTRTLRREKEARRGNSRSS